MYNVSFDPFLIPSVFDFLQRRRSKLEIKEAKRREDLEKVALANKIAENE